MLMREKSEKLRDKHNFYVGALGFERLDRIRPTFVIPFRITNTILHKATMVFPKTTAEGHLQPLFCSLWQVCRKFELATLEYEACKRSRSNCNPRKCETSKSSPSTSKSKAVTLQDETDNDSYGFAVPFHLVLTIRCPIAARNRLPAMYVYEAKSTKS